VYGIKWNHISFMARLSSRWGGYRPVADSAEGGKRAVVSPDPTGGFSGWVAGLGSGFGFDRLGAGPVITSKSKLLCCI
jgi:hypothetical protein